MHPISELDLQLSLSDITIYRLNLPQKEEFVSGIGVRKSREALIIRWTDQKGRVGYGECSCRPDPYYSAEFIDGAIQMVQKFVIPHLKENQTFGDLLKILARIRGWNFTKAALEAAALSILEQENPTLDLFAKLQSEPLTKVPVGISLGIQQDPQAFKKKVEESIAEGYKRLKFKISPTSNSEYFDLVNPMLFEAGVNISFDANGSFGMNDLDQLEYFVETYSGMIEQPFSPNRLDVLLSARDRFPKLKICFDEEVKSLGDLMKLHQLGLVGEVNLKIGRVGGWVESLKIIQYCEAHSIQCWIGGMFETGIGRIWNLRFASFLPNAIAHDLSPSDRYFAEDLVSPGVRMKEGHVYVDTLSQSQVIPEIVNKYTLEEINFSFEKSPA